MCQHNYDPRIAHSQQKSTLGFKLGANKLQSPRPSLGHGLFLCSSQMVFKGLLNTHTYARTCTRTRTRRITYDRLCTACRDWIIYPVVLYRKTLLILCLNYNVIGKIFVKSIMWMAIVSHFLLCSKVILWYNICPPPLPPAILSLFASDVDFYTPADFNTLYKHFRYIYEACIYNCFLFNIEMKLYNKSVLSPKLPLPLLPAVFFPSGLTGKVDILTCYLQ